MLPINWSRFTTPKTETITKIEITLTTTAAKLGKLQGAFGSSTDIEPDYWIMTKDMQTTLSGTEDTVTGMLLLMKLKLCNLKVMDNSNSEFGGLIVEPSQ